MIRTAVIFLTHLLLWGLIAVLNYTLAGWQLQIFAAGLFVTYPALRLGSREGLFSVLLAGLLFDTVAPVPFGQTALLFGLVHAWLLRLRPHMALSEPIMQSVTAALAGSLIYLVRIPLLSTPLPSVSGIWIRFFCELLLSATVCALIAPWFFSLQDRCLSLARQPVGLRSNDFSDEL